MPENNILASVALFSELYDSGRDIYDVIAEFIKTAAVSEAQWSFSATDATTMLEKTFDFKIPEAVVKTTIKNRLRRDNIVTFDPRSQLYTITDIPKDQLLISGLEELKENNFRILNNLKEYVEAKTLKVLSLEEISNLNRDFNSFLLGNSISDKHSQLISSFIIENQAIADFTERLNTIKEGLILYAGVRYTPDLNDLQAWPSDLTLFLDTEHIFNFAGYNGSVYKEIFMDFNGLVKDINIHSTKKSGKKKIELKFFNETKRQIDDFFHVAGLIIQRKATLDPTKTAMTEILNGCRTLSDIILKKNRLLQELKSYGIHQEDERDYFKDHSLVIEDPNTIAALKIASEQNNRHFDQEEARQVLLIFTKVNVLRKGINNSGLEKIGYIFVTGTGASLLWAHNGLIKRNEKDIPFASSMDFITDKFWFKLKKGLNDKKALPKSQDIITKAQMVLASQLNNSISKRYNELTAKAKQGKLTQDEAISSYAELREMVVNPEDIIPEFIDESLAFLNDDNLEKFLHERSLLLRKVQEGDAAIKTLKKIQSEQDRNRKKRKKDITKIYYSLSVILFVAVLFIVPFLIWKIIKDTKTNQDTTLGILGLVITLIVEFAGLLKFIKPLNKWVKNKMVKVYISSIGL
jgi:hypothetical protein